jgi:hypothetical protein
MLLKKFWKDVAERATKTAAQFAIVAFGAGVTDLANVDALAVLGAAGAGAVISFLTSVASRNIGDADSASVLPTEK